MAFPDIFRRVTGLEWSDDYEPFREIANVRVAEDLRHAPKPYREMQDVHDIAVSYYTMHLMSSGMSGGGSVVIGAKTSESLGDYSYSKAASRYDGLEQWLAKYREFLDGFISTVPAPVPLPHADWMSRFDNWPPWRRI